LNAHTPTFSPTVSTAAFTIAFFGGTVSLCATSGQLLDRQQAATMNVFEIISLIFYCFYETNIGLYGI
jgi:hypothetical protein